MSATSVNRKSPADMTGRLKAQLAEENAQEIRLRENEITLINAAAAEEKDHGITDATKPRRAPQPVKKVSVDVTDVEMEEPTREMRVNTKIENMTVGHGNLYDFEEGRTYKVKKTIYDHLDSKGYVWH